MLTEKNIVNGVVKISNNNLLLTILINMENKKRHDLRSFTLKELFLMDKSAIIQDGNSERFHSYDEIINYTIDRCKEQLGIELDNYYKLKKLVLGGVVDSDFDDEEQMLINPESGEWKALKKTQLYKQLMNSYE